MLFTGENEIEFTGLNPNGTKISKTLTVNIEELSDPVPPQWEMLFGNGEKDWTWSSSFCHLWGGQACFGNGGYLTDQLICWWTMGADSQDLTDAAGVDSQGAKMTFCKNGVKFIKTSNDGSTVEGRYSIDMNKKTYDEDGNVWAIGRLYIKANPSATILRGYGDDGKPQQEFDIIQMEDGLMQLSEVPAAGSGAWAGVLGWAFSPIQK